MSAILASLDCRSGPALLELRFMFLQESEWNNKNNTDQCFWSQTDSHSGHILKLHLQDNEHRLGTAVCKAGGGRDGGIIFISPRFLEINLSPSLPASRWSQEKMAV